MKLILARHGETIENSFGILQGQTHGTLSEKGILQAKELADRLRGENIDVCFSSDLCRAVDTAMIVLEKQTRKSYFKDSRLRERYLGDFEGQNIPANWNSTANYGGTESIEDLFNRVKSFIEFLQQNYTGKTILIISHGITIKAMMSICLSKDVLSMFGSVETINNCDAVSVCGVDFGSYILKDLMRV